MYPQFSSSGSTCTPKLKKNGHAGLRRKKKIGLFPVTAGKKVGSVGRDFFFLNIFLVGYFVLTKRDWMMQWLQFTYIMSLEIKDPHLYSQKGWKHHFLKFLLDHLKKKFESGIKWQGRSGNWKHTYFFFTPNRKRDSGLTPSFKNIKI